jgi:alpha 1,6-mannosyltransferase
MTLKDKYNPKPEVARNILSWKRFNPEYSVILYDDDDMREMFRVYRPDLLFAYDSLDHPVEKADFWRYLVVWVYGGVYVDSDVECVQSVRYWNDMFLRPPILQSSKDPLNYTHSVLAEKPHGANVNENMRIPKVIVGIEDHFETEEQRIKHVFTARTQFLQWAFASVPRHPLFDSILGNIVTFVQEERQGVRVSSGDPKIDILYRTGPGVFTRTIAEWLSRRNITSQDVVHGYPVIDGVGVLERDGFGWTGNIKKAAQNPQRVGIVHHFKGSWKKEDSCTFFCF